MTRRDGYLDRFGDRVLECNVMSLRKSPMSSSHLFEPEVLREAMEAAKAKRDGKCQNRLINQVTSLAKAAGNFGHGKIDRRFAKQNVLEVV